MQIGIAQMNSVPDPEKNLEQAEKLIDRLAERGAELIVLPEYAAFYGPQKLWADAAELQENSPFLAGMRRRAVMLGIAIHCSFLERAGNDVFNSSVVFDERGEQLAHYRKIHLFNAEVPGGRTYREGDTIRGGSTPVTFEYRGICFGMATCYDIRFPELFRLLVDKGAQVFLIPAAFTVETGRDHWELLLRARAIENLCYVMAAGQVGVCPPRMTTYGRSMAIDPWGVVLAQVGDRIGTCLAEVDMKILQQFRANLPVLSHRRRDIFS